MREYLKKIGRSDISFGVLFWLLFFGGLPFILISAILAAANITPALLNGESYAGVAGFMITIVTFPIVILLSTILLWLFIFIGRNLIKIIF